MNGTPNLRKPSFERSYSGPDSPFAHMSYSLNFFKGVQIGDYIGDYYRGY